MDAKQANAAFREHKAAEPHMQFASALTIIKQSIVNGQCEVRVTEEHYSFVKNQLVELGYEVGNFREGSRFGGPKCMIYWNKT